MSLVLVGSTSGSITLQEPAVAGSTTINLPASTGTMALLQTPSFATTIGVGGATAAASGAGITFPSTASLSSDANTLDDYEEGSFTPIVLGSVTAGTFTYNTGNTLGRYVKVGSLVNFQLAVQTTAGSSATGNVLVGGLPFTVRNLTNYYPSAAVGFFAYATSGWAQYDQSALLGTNTTTINLYYAGATGSVASDASALNGASLLYVSGSYLTDS